MTGPITNTRTMEGSLVEAIDRLKTFEQTPKLKGMIAKAEGFLAVVGTWEEQRPSTEEEYTVIPDVLILLKHCMTYNPEEDPTRDSSPEISVGPASDSDAAATSSATALGRLPVEKRDSRRIARGDSTRPPPKGRSGVSVLRPDRAPWQPIESLPGVCVKILNTDTGAGRCRALMRLDPGAELPARRHSVAEDLYVLSGLLQVGDYRVYSGELVRAEAGARSAGFRCIAEATLLLVGTDEDLFGAG